MRLDKILFSGAHGKYSRIASILLLAASMVLGGGCGGDESAKPGTHPAPELEPRESPEFEIPDYVKHEGEVLFYAPEMPAGIIDGFEGDLRWAVESADDHALLALSELNTTEGERSLRIDYETFGRGKFQIRREGSFDFLRAEKIVVDIYNEDEPMEVSIGLLNGSNDSFWGSDARVANSGMNRNMEFELHRENTEMTRYTRNRILENISRIMITFFNPQETDGTVFIDNLRVEPAVRVKPARPSIKRIESNAQAVNKFGKYELSINLDAEFKNPFDGDDVELSATFFSPSGRVKDIKGFLYEHGDEDGDDTWMIRFAPDEPGKWVFDVTATDSRGSDVSGLMDFFCLPDSVNGGYVRISREDPRFFELSDGSFFYPVGLNVAWASNMGHYFDRLAEQGANTVRIWMCPWHLPLEKKESAGSYDLVVAQRLDSIVELAELQDLRILLVFEYHGSLNETWEENPYNSANGGPCRRPEDFFTNPEARELFKRKLDYISARWGYSTGIFAWELWNEVGYSSFRRFSDVVEWHKEMGEYLESNDGHQRLITTSAGSQGLEDIAEIESIHFISEHLYADDLATAMLEAHERYEKMPKKPFLLAEYGLNRPGSKEEPGARLEFSSGMWLSLTMPWSGAGMSWWWDKHIDRKDLYDCLGSVSAAVSGDDRRGTHFRRIESELKTGKNMTADVRGIISPRLSYFCVYDGEKLANPNLAHRPLIRGGASFRLSGMLSGKYSVEIWDTRSGRLISSKNVTSRDGSITVILPDSIGELGARIKKLGHNDDPAF